MIAVIEKQARESADVNKVEGEESRYSNARQSVSIKIAWLSPIFGQARTGRIVARSRAGIRDQCLHYVTVVDHRADDVPRNQLVPTINEKSARADRTAPTRARRSAHADSFHVRLQLQACHPRTRWRMSAPLRRLIDECPGTSRRTSTNYHEISLHGDSNEIRNARLI